MNASGACQCPDGYGMVQGECVPCATDSYGTGGVCLACGAGTTTAQAGATACVACAFGLYREGGIGCENCSIPGFYAPNASQAVCVECNRTCLRPGWRWAAFCPGDESGDFSVCEPCDELPISGRWRNLTVDPSRNYRALEECAYDCGAGHYSNDGCILCNASRVCEPGWKLTPCSAFRDSHCDEPCVDDRKPRFYSHWTGGDCAWACDEGMALVTTDYVLFSIRECI